LRSENRMSWFSVKHYYWQHLALTILVVLLDWLAYVLEWLPNNSIGFVCFASLFCSVITVVAYSISLNALKKSAQMFMTQVLSSMMLRLMLNLAGVIVVILAWRPFANVYVLSLLFSYIMFTALELRTLLTVLNQEKKD